MIVTKPRRAIVTNPARHDDTPPNLAHARPLDRTHRVDLHFPDGRHFARLVGDDRAALEERADRWGSHISPRLVQNWARRNP